MARTYITDYIWNIIVLLLPPETGGKGRPCKPHRNILEGAQERRGVMCRRSFAPADYYSTDGAEMGFLNRF